MQRNRYGKNHSISFLGGAVSFSALTGEAKHIIDTVIDRLGFMTGSEIVALMHREKSIHCNSAGRCDSVQICRE